MEEMALIDRRSGQPGAPQTDAEARGAHRGERQIHLQMDKCAGG